MKIRVAKLWSLDKRAPRRYQSKHALGRHGNRNPSHSAGRAAGSGKTSARERTPALSVQTPSADDSVPVYPGGTSFTRLAFI